MGRVRVAGIAWLVLLLGATAAVARAQLNPGVVYAAVTGPDAPLNLFAPNACAYDGVSRVYFVAWDADKLRQARLCYLNILDAPIPGEQAFEYVQDLQEVDISGAAFDQEAYAFVDIREGTASSGLLVLVIEFLNRATGRPDGRRVINQFRDVTGGGSPPAGPLPLVYLAGDQAIDCSGILYASSVGDGAIQGAKAFFSLTPDSTNNPSILDYNLIHRDFPPNAELTGFATADQLAFAVSGVLVSQDSGLGRFLLVDLATGANGELGTEGVDYVVFYDPVTEEALTFADLASTLVCNIGNRCIATEVESQCDAGEFFTQYLPDPDGTIPCAPVERLCRVPPACIEEAECVYYIRTNLPN
ncbi:hypothetical protein FVE85_6756 [Porphyridium purpureum]|uniref:Uncharacterized protein n=1 Tax=Porphyridium purpureum TaxID=35688 RepID=A0A5J4Z5N4_PORPP|nr:hypothetical protein FVE85_6756 [Porphyridium purpureum]|eukprot:POR3604..scf295_1